MKEKVLSSSFLFPLPYFLLAHRHGVDQRKDFCRLDRAFPAQFHLPILADQDNG
jgi:hypothetical protein